MKILAYSPHAAPAEARAVGVELTSLDRVLREADFVSLHARLTESNHRVDQPRAIPRRKPTAYLVNVARGELVDQRALVETLATVASQGAALDVYEKNHRISDDPLLSLENIISYATLVVLDNRRIAHHQPRMREGMLRARKANCPENVLNREVLEDAELRSKLARFAAT